MANSRFAYVRRFELDDRLLPGTFLVVRIDGKGFSNFTTSHKFQKPNDDRGLNLMSAAATAVMRNIDGVFMAFGESDEYSFALARGCELYNRRESKLVSYFASAFTSAYCRLWARFFDKPLDMDDGSPIFDARVVQYPSFQHVIDYFKWRQADTHINNLYNTCFWKLVSSGRSTAEAHKDLQGTVSAQKNELLFQRFQVNYSALPEMHRRGTILLRDGKTVETLHEDLLKDSWWERSELSKVKSS